MDINKYKQAEQIVEFITLLEKIAGSITVPVGGKPAGPFVPSLKSKPPAPPLPPEEELIKQM